MKNNIEKAWERYQVLAVPSSVSPSGREPLRQAFFSGASILFTMMANGVSEGEEVQEKDMELMSDLNDEIQEFGQAIDAKYLASRPGVGQG